MDEENEKFDNKEYCEWNKRRFALCACPLLRWYYYVGVSRKKLYNKNRDPRPCINISGKRGKEEKLGEPIVEQPIWIIYFLRWTNKWMWNMPVLLCMYRYTRSHKSDGFFPSFPTSIYLFFYELFVFLRHNSSLLAHSLSYYIYIFYAGRLGTFIPHINMRKPQFFSPSDMKKVQQICSEQKNKKGRWYKNASYYCEPDIITLWHNLFDC